jgi:hypothetical protein
MSGEAADLTTEQIVAAFPAIAQSLEQAARRSGVSPTDMQTTFWNQAVHST